MITSIVRSELTHRVFPDLRNGWQSPSERLDCPNDCCAWEFENGWLLMALFDLCSADQVSPGTKVKGRLPNGRDVAIYNVDGVFYVTDDLCTHAQSSLSEEGSLNGFIVECGWHLGTFDVRTGEAKTFPCVDPLKTYKVAIVGGGVCIELDVPEMRSSVET
jgi:nitrite reductase/ring-hydroxylating ferredoxin subunit